MSYKREHNKGLTFVRCQNNSKSIKHSMMNCHFAKEVWDEICSLTIGKVTWDGSMLEKGLKGRLQDLSMLDKSCFLVDLLGYLDPR